MLLSQGGGGGLRDCSWPRVVLGNHNRGCGSLTSNAFVLLDFCVPGMWVTTTNTNSHPAPHLPPPPYLEEAMRNLSRISLLPAFPFLSDTVPGPRWFIPAFSLHTAVLFSLQ